MSDNFNSTAPELAYAARFYGLYSTVARKLGVTPQHVRQVAMGLRVSKRVLNAVKREAQKRRAGDTERAA